MKRFPWIGLTLMLLLFASARAQAQGWKKNDTDLAVISKRIRGRVIDQTANHGVDRRIWSRSLWERRDLYVYLPPGFTTAKKYPLMIWLHGFHQDEKMFLRHVVPVLDEAIVAGKLPPIIVAAPDGSFSGEPHPTRSGTFFLNTRVGDFADFVLYDVWDFITYNYPIRPDREAHVLAGFSMGGFAAYNYAIKHRNVFGSVIGICPPLNLRWMNKKGHYHANFDPRDWAWRMDLGKGLQPVARLTGLGKTVRFKHWFEPLYGLGMGSIPQIAAENPIEMLSRMNVCPGQLEMFVGYTGNDEFNIDAQVESFLYMCAWEGLHVGIGYEKHGKHNILTMKRLLPDAFQWLALRLAPFGCDACDAPCEPHMHPHSPSRRKMRLFGHRHTNRDDPSCHLPPLWLPDRVPD